MVGHLRIPHCLVKKPFTVSIGKLDFYSLKTVKKEYSMVPLVIVKGLVLLSLPIITAHRFFLTTIDVQVCGYHRFEIPSVPRFFDLRNPRSLKLIKDRNLQPAIHLDNRYRLMRGEPMLDANGNETSEIGDDGAYAPDMEEAYKEIRKSPYGLIQRL
ncbi:uncharacterized protein LOC105662556 [Megachile rotundata]|uniref:uncharacterized protein LOC105662556 n=1 Tax=Megachile rotundata TaxID=143995 RepID=UPI003FCF4ECE